MTKRMLVLALAVSSLVLGACSANLDISFDEEVVDGSGSITTETHDLNGFDKIEVCCKMEVEIQVSDDGSNSVEVETDDNLHSRLEIKIVDGDTLSIKTDSRSLSLESTGPIVVRISDPEIYKLHVKAAADVSGTFTAVDNFTIEADAAARVRAAVDTDNLTVKATSASEVMVTGEGDKLTVTGNSAASVDLEGFDARDAKIDFSSAAGLEVSATDSITGKASSGADVDVYGGPDTATVDTSSGATVNFR